MKNNKAISFYLTSNNINFTKTKMLIHTTVPIPIYIYIQLQSIVIHSVVVTIFWYCAKLIHLMENQLKAIIVLLVWKPSINVRMRSHGLELNKNILYWIPIIGHWVDQRTASQGHKAHTIVVLVLIRYMVVMLSMPITVPAYMLELKFVAPMLK